MPVIQINMYEALTEAGVQPAAARNVERQMEAALQQGHETIRADLFDRLMTKVDGRSMRTSLEGRTDKVRTDVEASIERVRTDLTVEIEKVRTAVQCAMVDQTWKLASIVLGANALMLALLKFLP